LVSAVLSKKVLLAKISLSAMVIFTIPLVV